MKLKLMLTAALVAGVYVSAHAAVTAEEAKKLGTTLTPWGADPSGNKEGTIPAYTGGITTMPPGFVMGKVRANPYAGEKPLFSIDAKNMDKYADKLPEGQKTLMKRFPTYRMDIYPTHRSVNYPKFVVDNTIKNATRCKSLQEGQSLSSECYGGPPFPIPKTANEMMLNHTNGRYWGHAMKATYQSVYVDATGKVVLVGEEKCHQEYPFYDPNRTSVDPDVPYQWMIRTDMLGPARVAGERGIAKYPIDYTKMDSMVWLYQTGQRRVRLAPDLAYDTPIPSRGGTQTMDDIQMFMGRMDRFDFKFIGKKEMYIPYNNYIALNEATDEEFYKPQHINPDVMRWELHRVNVIEATLKPGKRHIYHRRVFYQDEDSVSILSADQYDASGKMYRFGFAFCTPAYEIQAPSCSGAFGQYDFINGVYTFIGRMGKGRAAWASAPMTPREWSPDSLSGGGVR